VVGVQVGADAGIDAARFAAGGLDGGAFAAQPVHIRGGAAEVRDHTGEAGHLIADLLDFAHDRVFGAALDDAALVLGDGAKAATAKAAAHDVDAEADHLPSRDFGRPVVAALRIGVARVRAARIGQAKNPVHFGAAQGNGRRVDPDIAQPRAAAVRLHQSTRVAGVGLEVQHAAGVGVEHRVGAHLLVAGQADHAARALRG